MNIIVKQYYRRIISFRSHRTHSTDAAYCQMWARHHAARSVICRLCVCLSVEHTGKPCKTA